VEPPFRGRRAHHMLRAAAPVALVSGQPMLAGALLLSSLLSIRSPSGIQLRLDGSERGASAWLDVALGVAVAVSFALVSPPVAATTSPGWLLVVLPLLLAAASLLAHGARRAKLLGEPHGTLPRPTDAVARLLLALGLLLTPLAVNLSSMDAAHWTLTVLTAWAVVHALELARGLLKRMDPRGVAKNSQLVLLGKGSALRNAMAAILATAVDFSIFSLLVGLQTLSPPLATLVGAASGGVLNFTVNRSWTFSASGSKKTMVRRYVTVSAASAAWNASLVAALLWIPSQQVTVAWLIARGLVFLGWNYPLQRDYVFAHASQSAQKR
jgi:putative flippase GtrA